MEPKPSRSRNRAEENESLIRAGVASKSGAEQREESIATSGEGSTRHHRTQSTWEPAPVLSNFRPKGI